jgi:nucleotide-binding universal stress UspA family protein
MSMLKTLVVPLDGSKTAESAIDTAVYLARAFGAKLLLVRVSHLPETMLEAMGPNYYDLESELRQSAEKYLAATARKIDLGDQLETKILEGHPTERLLEVCESADADLVVMTSHGRSGVERWLLGSVAENFARRSICPVLILRGDSKVTLPLGQKVLVPLDGSELAEGILPAAQELASQANGELILLRSHHKSALGFDFDSHDLYPPSEDRVRAVDGAQIAKEYLTQKAQEIGADSGIKVSHYVTDSYPAEGILKEAEKTKADLIAMTSHGTTGLAKWIFGSVAEKVIRHADRPVLVLKSEWSRGGS